MYGYTVSQSPQNLYLSADLVHRLFHTPAFGEDVVGHHADSYDECLELAEHAPGEAVRNTHSLIYFALDVYAWDVSVPGVGCTGGNATATAAAAAGVTVTASGTAAAAKV